MICTDKVQHTVSISIMATDQIDLSWLLSCCKMEIPLYGAQLLAVAVGIATSWSLTQLIRRCQFGLTSGLFVQKYYWHLSKITRSILARNKPQGPKRSSMTGFF